MVQDIGSAFKVFQSLGAQVVVINNTPNGKIVNVKCGSTNLKRGIKVFEANLG